MEPDVAVLARIRDALLAADFTVDGVQGQLGRVAAEAMGRSELGPARWVWSRHADSVCAVLSGLFIGAQAYPLQVVRAAFAGVGGRVEDLLAAGLVESVGDEVRACWSVSPHHEEWFVVSDFATMATGAALPSDYVLGVGGASRTLAEFQLPTSAGSAWDMGTGCGVQALHAAQVCESVVATDISRRALWCARLTAALSGVVFETRQGSFAEPVAGQKFDRIVSNPPFVITPQHPKMPYYEYRDARLPGDELFDRLVADLPQHLTEHGTIQLLANWAVHQGQSWQDAIGQKLDGAGVDYWVVQRDVQDPAQYAQLWLADAGLESSSVAMELTHAWLDDFERRGIVEVGFGLVLLAHPGGLGAPLRRCEELTGALGPGVGEHVAGRLSTHRVWSSLSVERKTKVKLVRAPDVTEERHSIPGDADPRVIMLRQTAGFGQCLPVASDTAAFVGACDGDLSVGQICGAIAHLSDRSVAEVLGDALISIDALLWSGMLVIDSSV